jgi:hypothetical protein
VVRFVLFLGLAAHVAIAIWNGFFGPSFGAEGDAVNFHNEAIYYANNLGRFEYVTGWIYSYFLGFLYSIFTDHIFFGSMISVFAWFMSAVLLTKTMKILNFNNGAMIIAILIFSLWPSAVLNTSVTLRESFQTLGISCIVYASIAIFWKQSNKWIILIIGILISAPLHGALLLFSSFCLVSLLYNIFTYRLKIGFTPKIILLSMIGGSVTITGLFLLNNIAYNLDNGLIGAVESYNEGASAINARADYRVDTKLENLFDVIFFFPIAFLQYIFEPLPGRIGNIQDAILFFENLFRVALLLRAAFVNRQLSPVERPPHTFIFLAFIVLSVIWSVGTVNWGTASRHHAPGLMLVVLAALFPNPVRATAKRASTRNRKVLRPT